MRFLSLNYQFAHFTSGLERVGRKIQTEYMGLGMDRGR